MADQSILSGAHYARYKVGTERLAEWLVATANRCTDITVLVKAFEARDATERVVAHSVQLQTGEYLALAQPIAKAVKDGLFDVGVPYHVVGNLEIVIRLRRESHDFYAAISMRRYQSLSDDDMRHKHFIGLLRRVCSMLKEAHTTTCRRAANSSQVPSWMDAALNDEKEQQQSGQTKPTDKHLSSIRAARSKKNAQSKSKSIRTGTINRVDLSNATFKLSQESYDLKLALWCHLRDLYDVRVLCRDTGTTGAKAKSAPCMRL